MEWKCNENGMKREWKWNENVTKMEWKGNENGMKMEWKWNESRMKIEWKWKGGNVETLLRTGLCSYLEATTTFIKALWQLVHNNLPLHKIYILYLKKNVDIWKCDKIEYSFNTEIYWDIDNLYNYTNKEMCG